MERVAAVKALDDRIEAIEDQLFDNKSPKGRPAVRRFVRSRAACSGMDRVAAGHDHNIFETNLSLQDARLNTVIKKLTGWAAIIALLTAITGFYGRNVPYGAATGFEGGDDWIAG